MRKEFAKIGVQPNPAHGYAKEFRLLSGKYLHALKLFLIFRTRAIFHREKYNTFVAKWTQDLNKAFLSGGGTCDTQVFDDVGMKYDADSYRHKQNCVVYYNMAVKMKVLRASLRAMRNRVDAKLRSAAVPIIRQHIGAVEVARRKEYYEVVKGASGIWSWRNNVYDSEVGSDYGKNRRDLANCTLPDLTELNVPAP
jgi:hypothetical protein